MTVTPDPPAPSSRTTKPARLRLARRAAERVLEQVATGHIILIAEDGTHHAFGNQHASPVTVTVHDQRFYSELLHGGSVGVGASFIRGEWDCDDLVGLIQIVIANRDALRTLTPAGVLRVLADLAIHIARGNRIGRAQRNIAAHYDLSNDFYATFLDETMTYSAAYFARPGMTLEQAQQAKLRLLADKARLEPGQHVLEIGCGWGSFAIMAARDYGCQVTGITLSEQQAVLARERIAAAGLEDQVEIRLIDYRNITGSFDRIVSIEMLEAVGHRYLPAYFATIDRLLTPEGIAAIQVITLPGQREGSYRRRPDFIQRFVFPGGHLPSVKSMSSALATTRDLSIVHVEDLAMHYAETLRRWRVAFDEHAATVEQLGFDEAFQRLWRFYLAYCEAAFSTRYIHDLQLVVTRALNTSLGDEPYEGHLAHINPPAKQITSEDCPL